MLPIVFGAIVGALFFGAAGAGWLLGLVAGALGGCVLIVLSLRKQVAELSARVANVMLAATPPAPAEPRQALARPAPAPEPRIAAPPAVAAESGPPRAAAPVPPSRIPPSAHTPPRREPSPIDPILQAAVRYFTTGNVVARVGSVVLFFGLAFLLKYAADRNIVPIQLRLAGVFVVGIGLLVLGWRMRRRGVFGAVLQGTGIGTLYLTSYVAVKPYALVPAGAAFGVMVVVVALSGWLAVTQNSRPLATLGSLGGFLAPILTSTGEGSHVVLFTYYALLNVGILGVAWKRAWRELNLLGFVFTFVIASIWGYRAYQPRYFSTTEPFLVFHWALYVGVAVLFAARRRRAGLGYLDGTLVFGVPAAGFALQASIAEQFEQGLTLSALTAAAVYLGLSRGLQLRGGETMAPIRRAFTALGVAFATLAVPLAFDGSWLVGLWALEGAALVWVGTRHGGRLARFSGLGLQLAAGLAMATISEQATRPVLNGFFLAAATVAVAGMISAYFLTPPKDATPSPANILAPVTLAWGLLWWLGAGAGEIDHFAAVISAPEQMILFFVASAVAIDRIAWKLGWAMGSVPSALLLPGLWLMATRTLDDPLKPALLSWWGAGAWLAAAAAHVALLRWREKDWNGAVVRIWHPAGLLAATLLLSRESGWAAANPLHLAAAWRLVAWTVVPAVLLYLLPLAPATRWPLSGYRREYVHAALAVVAALLATWAIGATFRADPSTPLRYLPLVYPLELMQAVVLYGVWRWWREVRGAEPFAQVPAAVVPVALGLIGFLAINGVMARSVHSFGHVPFTADDLFRSRTFHAGLSILWSVLALGVMVTGSRRGIAPLWFIGSGLLGMVVLKLFFVELSGSGAIARIVSFLVVGLLMLLIGYLAPMPSRVEPELQVEAPPA